MRFLAIILFSVLPTPIKSKELKYAAAKNFPRPWGEQFQSFLPKYAGHLGNVSTEICNESLQDYKSAYAAPRGSLEASQLLIICYQHEACILDALSSDKMANFQSAGVVLGLLPTLLSTIGPSVGDIAVLSAHRPILSFLVNMGAPSILPSRILAYNDPEQFLMDDSRKFAFTLAPMKSTFLAVLISMAQYLLALTAVGNVFYTSLNLGQKSILSWGCTTNFLPVLWSSCGCVVYILAAAGYAMPKKSSHSSPERSKLEGLDGQALIADTSGPVRDRHAAKSWSPFAWLRRALLKETTICANQHIEKRSADTSVTNIAVLLNVAATSCGFIQVVFGTIVLSSLQLVSVYDVMNVVLWRYIASALVCRLVVIVELAGIQRGMSPVKKK